MTIKELAKQAIAKANKPNLHMLYYSPVPQVIHDYGADWTFTRRDTNIYPNMMIYFLRRIQNPNATIKANTKGDCFTILDPKSDTKDTFEIKDNCKIYVRLAEQYNYNSTDPIIINELRDALNAGLKRTKQQQYNQLMSILQGIQTIITR